MEPYADRGSTSPASGPLVSASLRGIAWLLARHARDLAAIVVVVGSFHLLVSGRLPADLGAKGLGILLLLVGLTLFVQGLSTSLFPLAEELTETIARDGRVPLVLGFAFCVGFASTAAEPALVSFTSQAAPLLAPDRGPAETARLADALRYGAAGGVGLSLVVSCLRIVLGWPAAGFVLGGYGVALALALVTPAPVAGIAFDAGVAATSAINIPLLAAIGVGFSTVLRARDPLLDGFGLVALASLMPMLTILAGAALFRGAA